MPKATSKEPHHHWLMLDVRRAEERCIPTHAVNEAALAADRGSASWAVVFSSVLQRREGFPNNREQKRRAEPEQKLSVEGFDCTHEVPAVVEAEVGVPVAC